jgi:catechol 2,3-dioxygenase-like lactoylglutathione lyase family enzyme
MTAVARLSLVALDCPDPLALARFYADITGWPIADDDSVWDGTEEWVQLVAPAGVTIAFQRVEDFRAPVWPGAEHPQQLHLDFDVPDLDAGEAGVLALGAVKHEEQPGTTFRVYLDPVGHPFCLVLHRDTVLDR